MKRLAPRALACLAAALVASCSVDPDIDWSGRQCPCDVGWACDADRDLCFAEPYHDGLVAWYPMDDDPSDGTVEDATLRGLDAHCDPEAGECPRAADGRVGRSVEVDGAPQQHLRVEPDPALEAGDGLTIAAWIHVAQPTRANVATRIHDDGLDGAAALWTLEVDAAGRAGFATFDGTAVERLWSAVASVPAGEWIHVAATFDGTTKRLWLGGSVVAEASAGAISGTGGALLIGGGGAADEFLPLPGRLDDVRIYGRALDETEVAELVAQ